MNIQTLYRVRYVDLETKTEHIDSKSKKVSNKDELKALLL
jgi:hypothetical protein